MTQSGEDKFVAYYEAESLTPATIDRFLGIKRAVNDAARMFGLAAGSWRVADIGCGAGTQCALWARDGHTVFGIDINKPLIEIGRRRVVEERLPIQLDVGTATQLPWADASMDICLCPELLEHVADWARCLDEVMRVVRPGGMIYLSTTNRLCPRQDEFNLPGYSWYPRALKRRIERLSTTTRPDLANYAKYPAVNWFTWFELRRYLATRGFRCLDRFDVALPGARGSARSLALHAIHRFRPARFLAHVVTPGTIVFAQRAQ